MLLATGLCFRTESLLFKPTQRMQPPTGHAASSSPDRRLILLRRMAWLCAVLVLSITSLSAFIRLTKAGLGCEPWPQCYAQRQLSPQQELPPVGTAEAAARLAHRTIATAALLLVILMVMTTLTTRPLLWPEGRMALGLLVLALFLAVLGRWTANARVPAVTLGNLLAGLAMFALSVRLALACGRMTDTGSPAQSQLSRWAWLAGAVLVVQIALGGLVSAGHAGLSCPQLTGCDVSGASWQAFNPWHTPQPDAAQPTHPAGAGVHALHRAGALLTAGVLLPLGLLAWRHGRRSAAVLVLGLLLTQGVLGATLILDGLPLAAALAHNVAAALLLAVVLTLAGRGSAAPLSPRL